MSVRDATPHPPVPREQDEERHRLTAFEGLAALSLDALSSVAYGPEAIVVVLAAASLIVDYVLNAAVGVSAGVAALTSAFPALYGGRVWVCLGVLAVITGINMLGAAESARIFIVPTVVFIIAIAVVIVGGLLRSHPVVAPSGHLPRIAESVGVLLLLRAFASGCSALTGVEAIANAVPSFREPRARRAQHTEMWLGIILGAMLIGIAILIKKFDVAPSTTETSLAQLAAAAVGHNVVFYAIQLITTVLLALAANTSFGGLPVLASLLARDNFLPHLFLLKADRQVHRYGISVLAVAAAILLVVAQGNTLALVPLFAIGVFVGFTLSQVGMVRHWHEQHGRGWAGRAAINGLGAVLTLVALAIELISKFTEGAWLIVLIIPLLVLMFSRVHSTYEKIGSLLQIGRIPPPPVKQDALVVVPVGGMSRLTQEGISAALSLGDQVIAVTVIFTGEEDTESEARLRQEWDDWHPGPTGYAAERAPLARAADRRIPARSRGPGQVPQDRRADPGSPARQALAADSAQPARIRAGPGHPEGHRQRGCLPSALPACHHVYGVT